VGVDVVGVVGISVLDFPRVGVRGGTSSGSLTAVMLVGGGAASEGRIGVDVCREICGAEDQGLVRMSMSTGSGMSLIAGVEGRESW
jgi:hypothetical protein